VADKELLKNSNAAQEPRCKTGTWGTRVEATGKPDGDNRLLVADKEAAQDGEPHEEQDADHEATKNQTE
jgi:hypothetical protein